MKAHDRTFPAYVVVDLAGNTEIGLALASPICATRLEPDEIALMRHRGDEIM
jgi:hypothetical protein